jgi:hypothetical protein
MIKFGSRTELFIPRWLGPQIRVAVGDKVRGAASIIASLASPIHTDAPRPDDHEYEPLAPRETPA